MSDLRATKEDSKTSFAHGVLTGSVLVNILLLIQNFLPGIRNFSGPAITLFLIIFVIVHLLGCGLNLSINQNHWSKSSLWLLALSAAPIWTLLPEKPFFLRGIWFLGLVIGQLAMLFTWLYLEKNSEKKGIEHNIFPHLTSEKGPGSNTESALVQETKNSETGFETGSTDFSSSEGDEEILHQITRIRQQDGTEIITGNLSLEIPAGSKTESVHLTFTPSLRNLPQIECEPISEIPVQVRVTETRNYGARLEVRRSENLDQACPVEIEYFVQEQ